MSVFSLAHAVSDKGIYLMVAVVTLMTFTHFRGTHLSGRVREQIKEFLYDMSQLSRDDSFKKRYEESIKWQMEQFLERHKTMSRVFIMLAFTVVLTMLAILLCSSSDNTLAIVGLTFSGLGVLSLGIAIFLLTKEFLAGCETLNKHVSTVFG